MEPVEQPQADEERPAKRVRLGAPLDITADTRDEDMDEDDWDDVYGSHTNTNSPQKPGAVASNAAVSAQAPVCDAPPPAFAPPESSAAELTSPQKEPVPVQPLPDGVPAEAVSKGDGLVAPSTQSARDQQEKRVRDETTTVERDAPVSHNHAEQSVSGAEAATSPLNGAQTADSVTAQQSGEADVPMLDTDGLISKPKATEDAEFMAAAAAQKGSKDSEWQYDSSDAESSSDSDTSSDDSSDESDSGSEGGYEMLDPATAAKILMAGEGDDDDGDKGKGKSGAEHQPRTANEVKEEVVPKPDVTVTADMKITLLGTVERTLENMALIKGATPGEYQVLESGSVLCNEKREVIGAVAETFGRVQEPLYSVAFTNEEEIEAAGVKYGVKVFYVDDHSTFVFTQPLKNLKGTDASNIHDEEVGEDELEFSDDEKEAEFKRQKKLAKKAGKGNLSRGDFNQGVSFDTPAYDRGRSYVSGGDAPMQTYGGGMSYDDDDQPADEFYAPLKRPDNLSELMAAGGPPPPPRPQHSFDRGRGRGRGDRGRGDRGRGDRGRGRGDRSRGRGGFEQRNQRGGRGGFQGHQQQGNTQRGNAHSFPDRHNSYSDADQRPSQHPKSHAPQKSPPAHQQYQAPAQYQQQSPQTYQFNGYTFQHGNPPPPQQAPPQDQQYAQYNGYYAQQQAQPSAGSVPAGTYVNPAFFQQQSQPQVYPAWNGQQQQQQYAQPYASGAAPANTGQQQPQVPDIGEILKRLGAPQGR